MQANAPFADRIQIFPIGPPVRPFLFNTFVEILSIFHRGT